MAVELARLGVALIVVGDDEVEPAAKAVQGALPLVITGGGDPLLSGLVKSYARPGGNVTGSSGITAELGAKRLSLIKEIVPGTRRVAVLHNLRSRVSQREWSETRNAARQLRLALDDFGLDRADDMQAALDTMKRTRPHALLVIVDTRMVGFREIVAGAALRERVPCIAGWKEFALSGALASYAPDFRVQFRNAARYAQRILKGAKPADLPVERPARFELVLNMRTARALGLTIPRSILIRADEVIE